MPSKVHLDDAEGEPHATLFPESEPKTIRLRLAAGESVPEHDHPGRVIVLHLLAGEVELSLDGEVHEAVAGDVLRFDGDQQIAPTAVEDSEALLVLAPAA